MTDAQAVDIMRELMQTAFATALPILVTAVGFGVMISLIQSVTSLQDQSLTFVPKLIAVGFVMVVMAPYIVKKLMDFAVKMIEAMPSMAP
ncbi:MAG: flagellar biosynthetic protein FliQ [Opitutae bacterium]|jgi:flagellar biosynthesis protein FliQ|nr:flagellar biosynthetic protein FliQ [Opitutae bacterium]MBT4224706.1 flagellar biosynthetic protein FliQ [Opitutae bacterium]MBT5380580.1 flagellar biosynthetic protein FliQ [Opitutae bacterium]MBT5692411.1 flagellar biosynthetic protein FliQ [Opitutae bacterium]MBT6463292.1 flagellar biosynthetic protein FliQ [Opitutae bacterium]